MIQTVCVKNVSIGCGGGALICIRRSNHIIQCVCVCVFVRVCVCVRMRAKEYVCVCESVFMIVETENYIN